MFTCAGIRFTLGLSNSGPQKHMYHTWLLQTVYSDFADTIHASKAAIEVVMVDLICLIRGQFRYFSLFLCLFLVSSSNTFLIM